MKRGIVKFYNTPRGFGFIVDSSSNKEYFVHATGLVESIQENDTVVFELAQGENGCNAVNVRKI